MIPLLLKALIAALLLLTALALGVAALQAMLRRPPPRRADDPAADPHALPYGDVTPGYALDDLDRFDAGATDGERGWRR